MTQLERLTALLTDMGVGYSLEESEGGYMIDGKTIHIEGGKIVKLEVNHHAKVIGYTGFTSEYYFDNTGNLVHVGVWE